MSSSGTSDSALAALLAEVLADEGFWKDFALAPTAGERSPVLAARAVELYLATGSFIEEKELLDPQAPGVRTVGILREIAAFAAMGSYPGEKLVEMGGEMPPRSTFEWLIRADEIDTWASQLGFQLAITQGDEFPEEGWPKNAPDDDTSDTAGFVEAWQAASDTYGATLERFKEDFFREGWASTVAQGSPAVETFREGAADALREMRAWLSWARRNLPTDAEPLGVAGVVIPETLFVLGWRPPEEALVPGPGYLSDFLRDSGALDWLMENGGAEPDWLT